MVFRQLYAVYVADPARSRQMEENNRWAYPSMIERLPESGQRGYWQPGQEELELLHRKYIELEGSLEETTQ